ncbi:MAG: accessory gene regulator B family protein [Clostridia bacterium]|nr:accessory gene regulator B family protein [Clostridia bacterium]
MIKKIAFDITSFLVEEKIIGNDDKEIYQYGTEQILINSLTLAVIGIISVIMFSWVQALFWMIGMLPIRALAGGYHASTPFNCNVLTIAVFVLNMFIIDILINHITSVSSILILLFIYLSLVFFAPVDHKNKVLDEIETVIAKKKSILFGITILTTCTVLIGMLGAKNVYSISIMMGALTATISLIIGSIKRGGE